MSVGLMGARFICEVEPFTVPEVSCWTLKTPSGNWAAFVPVCPYCGKNHQHPAGAGQRPMLGYRSVTCRYKYHSAYTLVDKQ